MFGFNKASHVLTTNLLLTSSAKISSPWYTMNFLGLFKLEFP